MYRFVSVVLLFTLKVLTVNAATLSASSSMASLDYSKLPIQEKALHVPPLEDIVEVLARGLPATFETVEVSAVECPDLTQAPYHLTSPGLSGDPKLVEIGGPPYLLPLVQRDKLYDLAALLRHQRRDPGFLAGAGAGPWPYLGVNCEWPSMVHPPYYGLIIEGIINLSVRNGSVAQGTRIVSVEPRGAARGAAGFLQQQLPPAETRTALLGNYLLSDGSPGKVIKVVAKKRIGESNFITAIRETLKNHYGDKVVGLGGTFVLLAGSVKFHVMPEFSAAPLCSDKAVDEWLHYFTMSAPITHVGTLVTGDMGLDLRVQHFHGFSLHGEGGHYHYDVTAQAAHYEGYFVAGASLLRVDRPHETHAFGRD